MAGFPSGTFRQSGFVFQGGGMRSFSGGNQNILPISSGERFGGVQSIPIFTPSLPANTSFPTVGNPSVSVRVGYEEKKFPSRSEIKEEFRTSTQLDHPELPSEIIESIAERNSIIFMEKLTNDAKGRNKRVSYNTDEIPKDTQWEDVRIHISKFNEQSARDTIVQITIKGLGIISRDFQDMEFEDTNTGVISSAGVLLALMSIGKPFISEEVIMSERYRTLKMVITQTLSKYFVGIPDEPIILSGNKYIPRIQLTADKEVVGALGQYNIPTLFRTKKKY